MSHPFRPLFVEVDGIPPRSSWRTAFDREVAGLAYMFKLAYAPMTTHQPRVTSMGGET